jgi:hypothetical protein
VAAGKPTWYEREGEESGDEPDLDAMGNDKRRAVIGQQYGASARKRLIVYGVAVGVMVLVVVAFATVVSSVDNRDIAVENTAPWAQAGVRQEPPRDVDFSRNGPDDSVAPDQVFER